MTSARGSLARTSPSIRSATESALDRPGSGNERRAARRTTAVPRARVRTAWKATQLSPLVEERIVAFALGHPGYAPKRIASELGRERWGGLVVSHNGVWRCLFRH